MLLVIFAVGTTGMFSSSSDPEEEFGSDKFEDLGHFELGPSKVAGTLTILQITDLHRFPNGE
jgi:hypothetical protein